MSSKQDRQGVRTAAQLEQKYSLNQDKAFAEIMGISTDARDAANKAQQELNDLFTKDLTMSGTFSNTAEVFLEPDNEEIETIKLHIIGSNEITDTDLIKYYDFNNDGEINVVDLAMAVKARLGIISLADSDWAYAKQKSKVTVTIDISNPNKIITIKGKNIWGRDIERFIGINYSNIPNGQNTDYIVERGTYGIWTYEKWSSGKAVCWGVQSFYEETASTESSGITSTFGDANVDYSTRVTEFPNTNEDGTFFAEKPSVFVTANDKDAGVVACENDGSDQKECKITLFGKKEAFGDANIYAIGKWK